MLRCIYFLSKFGDYSLNEWLVMGRTSSKLGTIWLSQKIIGTLTKYLCTFVPNMVILAWTSGELSCRQARDWYTHTRTHGHTDTQTQATTIPEGQNWPRVIKRSTTKACLVFILYASYSIKLRAFNTHRSILTHYAEDLLANTICKHYPQWKYFSFTHWDRVTHIYMRQ